MICASYTLCRFFISKPIPPHHVLGCVASSFLSLDADCFSCLLDLIIFSSKLAKKKPKVSMEVTVKMGAASKQ